MDLVDGAASQNEIPMIAKDVAWLWRTAYNTGMQGCEEWPAHGEEIARLFEIAARVSRALPRPGLLLGEVIDDHDGFVDDGALREARS